MKSFSPFFALGALLASTVAGQSQYSIEPDSVSLHMRKQWCTQQTTQCPLICLQTSARSSETEHNECNPHTLDYSCVCSNGHSPNLTEYSETMPYFICTEWGTQCVANCGEDNLCAAACRQNHPCGAQDPKLQSSSTITTSTVHATGKKSGSDQAKTTTTATTSAGLGTVCTGLGTEACAPATETSPMAKSDTASVAARTLSVGLHGSGKTVGLTFLLGTFFLGFALVL